MKNDLPYPEVGTVLTGRIVSFRDGAAMMDIGYRSKALLTPNELCWKDELRPIEEHVALDDVLEVVVTKVKPKSDGWAFVKVSYRKTKPNPWHTAADEHPIGSRAKGTVEHFINFGAIIKLKSGFRALVHNAQLSWLDPKAKASSMFQIGQEIEVIIQLVDMDKRRIHASYKQTTEDPWATFLQHFPIGSVTTGIVDRLAEFGTFLRLPNGCVGLLHKSQVLPTDPPFSPGDSVIVVIRDFDSQKQRIALGRAQ